jgi:hypothetical protein
MRNSGRQCSRKHVLDFRVFIDEPQKWLAGGARSTDAKQVFCGRIELNDKKIAIEQDDRRCQAIDDVGRQQRIRRVARCRARYLPILFCCT